MYKEPLCEVFLFARLLVRELKSKKYHPIMLELCSMLHDQHQNYAGIIHTGLVYLGASGFYPLQGRNPTESIKMVKHIRDTNEQNPTNRITLSIEIEKTKPELLDLK